MLMLTGQVSRDQIQWTIPLGRRGFFHIYWKRWNPPKSPDQIQHKGTFPLGGGAEPGGLFSVYWKWGVMNSQHNIWANLRHRYIFILAAVSSAYFKLLKLIKMTSSVSIRRQTCGGNSDRIVNLRVVVAIFIVSCITWVACYLRIILNSHVLEILTRDAPLITI